MPEQDHRKPSPGILRKAERIVRMRLVHSDTSHPAVAAIVEEGTLLVARELLRDPLRFEARPMPDLSDGPFGLGSLEEAARKAKLPPLPQILLELQRVMNDPDSSASDLARVISKDPKLTATLLRIVNSALFNFPSQIETVSRAVAVVGTKQLSTLASGTLLLSMFRPDPYGLIDLEAFWKHSIAVGTYARAIAARRKLDDPERFFVSGLLHDIGWIALANAFPEAVTASLKRAEELKVDMALAEKEVLGFDHAVFGAYLLRQWKFPLLLIAGVAYHHDPERGEKYAEPKILHAANFMANGMGLTIAGLCPVQPLHPESWAKLQLTGEDVRTLIREVDAEIRSTFSILAPS
jgi:putative nucleotidyltransferase with HDIG domain